MNLLVYLLYGDDRRYYRQAQLSILSALRFLSPRGADDVRILVRTEQPEPFAGYPVIVEALDRAQLLAWAGPRRYLHRAKNRVMAQAMGEHRAKTLLIDSDTYFARSPRLLFDRIGAGRSVLHKDEGPIARCGRELRESLARVSIAMPDGSRYAPAAGARMWNSGVVGLDPADARLLDEALFLVDELYARTGISNMEQFGLGEVLSRRTRVRQADRVVVHYWGRAVPFFDAKLSCFFSRHADEGLEWLVRRSAACTASIPRDRSLPGTLAKLTWWLKGYDGPLRHACKAARYGTARQRDELQQAAQSVWRNRAREILNRRLSEPPATRPDRSELDTWSRCRALAAVREPSALARLPAPERQPWRDLWERVAQG